jgi:hypothetical protein
MKRQKKDINKKRERRGIWRVCIKKTYNYSLIRRTRTYQQLKLPNEDPELGDNLH